MSAVKMRVGDAFVLLRVSAKDRKCDTCGGLIRKGSTYARHSLPPNSDLGNPRWWSLSSCGVSTTDCPDRREWI